MKLAVALQLRNTMTEAILRQPAPQLAHRVGSSVTPARHGITGSGPLQPIGQAKPLTETKNLRLAPTDGLDAHLAALVAKEGVLTFDVETQQMYRQLEALDALIQEANHTAKNSMPASVPLEPGDVQGVKKTLAAFLLRRKTLKERATRLEMFLAAVPQRPVIMRTKVNETVDNVDITYPVLDSQEVRRTHNQTMMALRAIDNLIQQANWAIEVPVPAWVRQGFLTDDVDPVKGPIEARTATEPMPTASPVAPMLSVPGAAPILAAPALIAKGSSPAAATPAAGTSLFIPPNLESTDDDTDPGWGS